MLRDRTALCGLEQVGIALQHLMCLTQYKLGSQCMSAASRMDSFQDGHLVILPCVANFYSA